MTAKDILKISDSATSVLRTDTRWPQCTCSDSMTSCAKWANLKITQSGKPSKNGIKDYRRTHCCRRFSKQASKTLELVWPVELLEANNQLASGLRLRALAQQPLKEEPAPDLEASVRIRISLELIRPTIHRVLYLVKIQTSKTISRHKVYRSVVRTTPAKPLEA